MDYSENNKGAVKSDRTLLFLLFPTHAVDSAKLLGCADDAMYKAKQLKNAYKLYVYAGK